MVKAKAHIRIPFKSGLEKRFAFYLETLRKAGLIYRWRYEPCRWKLADDTYYKVDFMVTLYTGEIIYLETKGWHKNIRDSITRFRVAAKRFDEFAWIFVTEKGGTFYFVHYYKPSTSEAKAFPPTQRLPLSKAKKKKKQAPKRPRQKKPPTPKA